MEVLVPVELHIGKLKLDKGMKGLIGTLLQEKLRKTMKEEAPEAAIVRRIRADDI